MMIEPHGGHLVKQVASPDLREELISKAASLLKVEISVREACDAELIAFGAYSPLTGFLKREDYEKVLSDLRLKNGFVWSLPITLSVSEEVASLIDEGEEIALIYEESLIAILTVEEKFEYVKEKEAQLVFKTTEDSHPGVSSLYRQGDIYIGGNIVLLNSIFHSSRPEILTPAVSRAEFNRRQWNTIVGFQTRNPIHRAHEYLLKSALEISDGLFIHPLVGHTKEDDVPADIRLNCYRVLLDNYFPRKRVVLSPLPAAMRYAGPREAIFHALVRKNYGCTHFIVGRDHAGVGNYYGAFEAQEIFSKFEPGEIGILPLFFDNAFYCYSCRSMATQKTCPHDDDRRLFLSGSKVREMLKKREELPLEFTRMEVANLLTEWATDRFEYQI